MKSTLAAAALATAAALLLTVTIGTIGNGPALAQDGWRSDRDQDRTGLDPRPPAAHRQGRDQGAAQGREPRKDGKSAKAPPEPKPIPKSMRRPGATAVPESAAERAKLLDELYAHLATAEDEGVATRITNAIEHIWLTSGSDTVGLLMERARRAMGQKQPELATRILDRAVQLAPDYPEVFNRRAAVHFARNNLQQAVGDLRRVLALDPNHYKALEALGQIFKEMENKKAALEVYRKLFEVHPNMSGLKSTFEELQREVEGQPT